MKILVIWKRLSIGGINSGWRNRAIYFARHGITTDFLFTEDKGGKSIIEDVANYYLTDNSAEIKNIIISNHYDCIIIVDYSDIYPLLQDINYKGKIVHESRVPLKEYVQYQFEQNYKISPSLIIVPSVYQKGLVTYSLKDRKIPIKVLYNTIDTEYFKPINKDCLIQDNSIPKDKKIIGWIGNLINQQKQWTFLLQFARRLVRQRKDIHFWVIGGKESDEKEKFMKQVEYYRLNHYLDWYPAIDYQKLPMIYNQISHSGGCLFSTSKRESFGNIFTEAMASNCPIVAPNVTAIPEVIEHNKTGKLYRSKSIKSATYQLNELLDNPIQRQKLIDLAHKEVQERFSFDTSAKKYVETLWKVTRNP